MEEKKNNDDIFGISQNPVINNAIKDSKGNRIASLRANGEVVGK